MMDTILKLSNVSKGYKKTTVLDGIDMEIKRGEIYGLIGLNGAGKSTLIKIITGMIFKNSGEMELFHEHDEKKIELQRAKIGALIEKPGLYDGKSVYENMNINRVLKGVPGEECIDKYLKAVGIYDLKYKKVKTLSVGAKQRLGIAMTLLGEPEFLVLDEPINGIDPMGIIEIRELLKRLNLESGVTMLISSHILRELHEIATNYGIIHKGRIIEQISSEELKAKCGKYVHIKVEDSAKAVVVINDCLKTSNFDVLPENVIKLYDYVEDTGRINSELVKRGVIVKEIMPMEEELEVYFSKVIGGKYV